MYTLVRVGMKLLHVSFCRSLGPACMWQSERSWCCISQGKSAGGDLKTGYMEKRIGEHSNRQSLPESWKWQKRYWVLSEPKGLLYYFKSADDPPTYRGIINIRECRIEDVDINGQPKTSSRSKYDLDGGGGTVSLLIKVSHKVRLAPG